ncbi:MAG: hypothetical protein AAB581_01780 [Patescibacteria group bacterium]
MAKTKKSSAGKRVVLGAALAAAAAVAAGAYLLKTNPKAKAWARTAKKDVLVGMKKMKGMNEEAYRTVVRNVMRGYTKVKNVDPTEIAALTRELGGHWKNIRKHLAHAEKEAVRTAVKTVKSGVRTGRKFARKIR